MNKGLVIFGSSEIASLAKYYFSEDSDYEVCAFTVDDGFEGGRSSIDDTPLVSFSQMLSKYPPHEFDMHVAVSYVNMNRLRKEKYLQCKERGYTMASYISSSAEVSKKSKIGENCLILENQTVQVGVEIGNNVMIWSGNHIGHGTIVEDHAYISSHVVISGHCIIGEASFLGVNSTIKDFTTIGASCFIGMGANVVANMADGSVAIDKSTQIFNADDRRARAIRRAYFGS